MAQFLTATGWGGSPPEELFATYTPRQFKPLLADRGAQELVKLRSLDALRAIKQPNARALTPAAMEAAELPLYGTPPGLGTEPDVGSVPGIEAFGRTGNSAEVSGMGQYLDPLDQAEALGKGDYYRRLTGPQQMTELGIKAAQDTGNVFRSQREALERRMGERTATPYPIRGMAMVNGVPTPTYRQPSDVPPQLAQALGLPDPNADESRLDAVFGGPVPTQGASLVAGQDARRKILGLPARGDSVPLDAGERALARRGGAGAAGSVGGAGASGPSGSAVWPQYHPQNIFSQTDAPPASAGLTPREKFALSSGSNYGVYGSSPADDPRNSEKWKQARELRRLKQLDRQPAIQANAQMRKLQRDVALGRPVPVQGDVISLRAAMGDPVAAEIMNRRADLEQRGQLTREGYASNENIAGMTTEPKEAAEQRLWDAKHTDVVTGLLGQMLQGQNRAPTPNEIARANATANIIHPPIGGAKTQATPTTQAGTASPAPEPKTLEDALGVIQQYAVHPVFKTLRITPETDQNALTRLLWKRAADLDDENLNAIREWAIAKKKVDPKWLRSGVARTPTTYIDTLISGGPSAVRALSEKNKAADKKRAEDSGWGTGM